MKIFIAALSILIGFRIVNYFIKNHLKDNKTNHYLKLLLPLFELFIWISFLIWVAQSVYAKLNLVGLISLAVLALIFIIPSFYLLRDFIYGFVLKFQNKIAVGRYIEFDETKGSILKAGPFRIELSDELHHIISIPYSKLYEKEITDTQVNIHLKKVSIYINFQSKLKTKEIIENLKFHLLNTPWVSVAQESLIEQIDSDGANYKVKVGVYLLHEKFAENLKEMVESNMSERR